jgi:glycerol-3-phosphate O-acyltransferase / dihydroxyacetone phosphate acyltransferase
VAAAAPSPFVRWLARVVTRLFYRVDRAGRVPESGAVLLLPNHPNALLDPAIVWATAGRDVRFLAKSTLFEGAFAPILERAGAIPVYRRIDQGADTARNTETFRAVADALAAGDAVCIFPEGISHSEGRLVPLRTGAARMAIAAESTGTRVQLVAVGLNFDRKTAFRSRVTVLYGHPFSVHDIAASSSSDAQTGVRAATERIADEMRRLLVEVDPARDAAVVRRIDRLYAAARGPAASPHERVARLQAIATGVQRLRERDAARYVDIELKLRRYDQRLARFKLHDRHLDWDLSNAAAVRFLLRELGMAIVCVPLAAAALVTFWTPYRATGVLARLATAHRDVAATATLFVGAAVYAAWIGLLATIVGLLFGTTIGVVSAIGLPILAIAGLFAVEREGSVLATARAWLTMRRAAQYSRSRLRRQRGELAAVLDDVYEWLSADTSAPAGGQRPN